MVGASAIILFAFGTWLVLASALYMIRIVSNIPFALAVILWPFLISSLTNNHHIRLLKQSNITPLPTVKGDFESWLSQIDDSTSLKHEDSTIVYLVAAEGGGIRAAYYSCAVLTALNQVDSNFGKQCYAISSVSGGSLGAAAFLRHLEQGDKNSMAWKTMLTQDYISHITAKLAFDDMIQRFVPFNIPSFDRAKGLEKDWEKSMKKAWNLKMDEEKKGFLDFHRTNGKGPRMLLNCTEVETGNRLLISPFKANSFYRSQNLLEVVSSDIPLSTAVSLSARFPYLTPAGLVDLGHKKISVVDGGYFDNSGTQSLYELYVQLKKEIPRNRKVKFAFIVLKNSKKPDLMHQGMLHESLGPVRTFLNVWDARGYFAMQQLKMRSQDDGSLYHPIYLDRKEEERIPLGWYISKDAASFMDQDVKNKEVQLKEVLGIKNGEFSVYRR